MKRNSVFFAIAFVALSSLAFAQIPKIPAGTSRDKAVRAIADTYKQLESVTIVIDTQLAGDTVTDVYGETWQELLIGVLKPYYTFKVSSDGVIHVIQRGTPPSKPGRPTVTINPEPANDRPGPNQTRPGYPANPTYSGQQIPAQSAVPTYAMPNQYYGYPQLPAQSATYGYYGQGYGYGNNAYYGQYWNGMPIFGFQLDEMRQRLQDRREVGKIKFKGGRGCDSGCMKNIHILVVGDDGKEYYLAGAGQSNNWYEQDVLVPVEKGHTVKLWIVREEAGTMRGVERDLILLPIAIQDKAKSFQIDQEMFNTARELKILQQHVQVEVAPGKYETKPGAVVIR